MANHIMKRLFALLALAAVATGCCGQPLRLFFADAAEAQPGDTVRVALQAAHFQQIGSLQFGLCWDTAALRYAGAAGAALPPALLLGDTHTDAGELGVSWFSGTGLDQSLPDSTVLLHAFFVPHPCSGTASLSFCNLENLPIEAGQLSGNSVAVDCTNGQVPHPLHQVSATICQGDVFLFNGKKLSAAGGYADTLLAANGCDSLVRLRLKVLPAAVSEVSATICAGDVFLFNGKILDAAGGYADTLLAANGCDSLVRLRLKVLPAAVSEVSATICAGDVFLFNGKILDAAGGYADTLLAANGCDSLVRLRLEVLPKTLYVPNVFSPNGDGLNDRFSVFGGRAVASVRLLRVYDRWGSLVFEGRDLPPDGSSGWDGRSAAGGDCPPGIYVWRYEAALANGERSAGAGDVLLVR